MAIASSRVPVYFSRLDREDLNLHLTVLETVALPIKLLSKVGAELPRPLHSSLRASGNPMPQAYVRLSPKWGGLF